VPPVDVVSIPVNTEAFMRGRTYSLGQGSTSDTLTVSTVQDIIGITIVNGYFLVRVGPLME
jgi:hypothetical protein